MSGSPDARWRPHTHAYSGLPKKAYSREEAIATAKRIAEEDIDNGLAFKMDPCPYPCSDPGCGMWHIGNWSDEAFFAHQREIRGETI